MPTRKAKTKRIRREREYTYLFFKQRGGWKYCFQVHSLTPRQAQRYRRQLARQVFGQKKGTTVRCFREVTRA